MLMFTDGGETDNNLSRSSSTRFVIPCRASCIKLLSLYMFAPKLLGLMPTPKPLSKGWPLESFPGGVYVGCQKLFKGTLGATVMAVSPGSSNLLLMVGFVMSPVREQNICSPHRAALKLSVDLVPS